MCTSCSTEISVATGSRDHPTRQQVLLYHLQYIKAIQEFWYVRMIVAIATTTTSVQSFEIGME